jgi:hypothetical protein
MESTARDDCTRIQAYVSAELADSVRQRAAAKGRSVSSYVGHVLRLTLRAERETEEEDENEPDLVPAQK